MSRLINLALAVSASTIAVIGLQGAPAHAATTARTQAELGGELGFEGGAYPGGFHPTAGSVEVEFYLQPLVLDQPVGPSGHFRIRLAPGQYTVIGCGPAASTGTASALCGEPENLTLTSGEVDHIKLVWAYTP
ncbi:MAG: hypothetical protein ACLPVF_05665 [Acidimicrobiales bacterium]